MRFPQLFLFLFCCLWFFSLFGQQNPQPYFRNYTTEHGLPSPEVYVAFQDSRGYLWFGTDNGASRFDGYAFRNYGAKEGLTSNVVFDIYEDAKGRIWFGTMTGEVFILEKDSIIPYAFNDRVLKYKDEYKDAGLVHLNPAYETAYIELMNKGILRIDSLGKDTLFATSKPRGEMALELPNHSGVLPTSVTNPGNKEYSTWINYLSGRSVLYFEYLSDKHPWQIEIPYKILKDCFNQTYIQRTKNGQLLYYYCRQLFCLEKGKVRWEIPFETRITEIIEGKNSALWMCGQEGAGLRYYNDLEAIRKGTYQSFLKGISATNLLQDRQGGLWVTSQEQGVFYCPSRDLLCYDSRFGFSDDYISALDFKNEHELFVGCENGDIFQVDIQENKIKEQFPNYHRYHNHDLLYQAEADRLWSNGGRYKGGEWTFPTYGASGDFKTFFRSARYEKLHINRKNELLGVEGVGITIIDLSQDTIKFRSNPVWGQQRFFAIHTAPDGKIWTGKADGLFQLKDSSLVENAVDHPAFHARVEDIDHLPDSSLVFGTKGFGVIVWKGENILQISTEDGLSSNMIEDVHVDENGLLWVSTLAGLNKITFDKTDAPLMRQFNMATGLPSNEIYKIRSYEGQVWLCTGNGLVKFQEPPLDTISKAPDIQYVHVNGQSAALNTKTSFPYTDNQFEFQFLTVNFRQNGQIPYRYRIKAEAPWQYTQNRTVDYPQLPPGNYRFEVQAKNEFNYWSPSTIYEFSILPPWWQTWWARSLAALVLLGVVIFFFRRNADRIRKEAAVQQQIKELERSALQAQMNPHFIFNCLNSIQNFILTNDKKKAVEYLARFASLVRHNLNASVQGKVTLEEERKILDNYLALECERFNHRIEYEVQVENSIDEQAVSFPPLLIQPFVENAVIHGLAKKESGGKVSVHFAQDNGCLLATIRDNGVGYRMDQQEKSNTRHRSVGMTITQKRLQILGNTDQEQVQIQTLKDEQGTINGTEVRVRIHLNEAS